MQETCAIQAKRRGAGGALGTGSNGDYWEGPTTTANWLTGPWSLGHAPNSTGQSGEEAVFYGDGTGGATNNSINVTGTVSPPAAIIVGKGYTGTINIGTNTASVTLNVQGWVSLGETGTSAAKIAIYKNSTLKVQGASMSGGPGHSTLTNFNFDPTVFVDGSIPSVQMGGDCTINNTVACNMGVTFEQTSGTLTFDKAQSTYVELFNDMDLIIEAAATCKIGDGGQTMLTHDRLSPNSMFDNEGTTNPEMGLTVNGVTCSVSIYNNGLFTLDLAAGGTGVARITVNGGSDDAKGMPFLMKAGSLKLYAPCTLDLGGFGYEQDGGTLYVYGGAGALIQTATDGTAANYLYGGTVKVGQGDGQYNRLQFTSDLYINGASLVFYVDTNDATKYDDIIVGTQTHIDKDIVNHNKSNITVNKIGNGNATIDALLIQDGQGNIDGDFQGNIILNGLVEHKSGEIWSVGTT
jgi:hypothetical protein